MLGNRLSSLPGQRTDLRQYRLALADGSHVDLAIDWAAGQVSIQGAEAAAEACARLIRTVDNQAAAGGSDIRLLPLRGAPSASIQRAAALIRSATGTRAGEVPMIATLFQAKDATPAAAAPVAAPAAAVPARPAAPPAPAQATQQPMDNKPHSGLVNPVQIEMLDGLDVLVLRGNAQDVEQVMEIINQVERLSAETEPSLEIHPLANLDCQAMASLVRSLYDEVFYTRQGTVSITPLIRPNALLLVGRPENVQSVISLIKRLDQPAVPGSQFKVFHLRSASAMAVRTTIQECFMNQGGLSPVVRVIVDTRSNALIVQASPRDMAEVAELVRRIDTPNSEAVNEVRIISLEHSMAQDVATILLGAIGAAGGNRPGMPGGQMPGMGGAGQGMAGQGIPGQGMPFGAGAIPGQGIQGGQPGQFGQGGQANQFGQAGQAGRPVTDQRSAMLRFLTVDAKGRKILNSGILSDVRITPDVRANALVISAPPENLELLEALVRQLDKLPAAEAQIKVFTIVNGDASSLSDMLKMLFATQMAAGAQQQAGMQTAANSSENSLVSLRFGVDARTNSIIASGSMGDLNVVEAILTRLDDGEARHRKSMVMRLKNAPAVDVANTINDFLTKDRQFQQAAPGMTNAMEQIEREVVVVSEPVSNSLVLSATPRFFEEVKGIIEQLDSRPPMVMIQVLIAQIELGNTDEFGMELGLQDSVLFDRSLLSNLTTLTTTSTPAGQPQVTSQTVVGADNKPGYAFNNGDPLGNSGSSKSLATAGNVAGQGISNFSVGRTNSQLGYSGLVLSASSENVSFLLRALAENHRVEVLQRPQIMTLDNQPAYIQVGKRVPRITNTQQTSFGQTSSIQLDNVGLILGVTPRISPDGLVVMEIDAEKSELEDPAGGIPITTVNNQVIRSPIIDSTTAQTTVSAMSEQTVVLGGLIAKSKNETHRKVPWLGDVPVLGHLFRSDSSSSTKTELLIIMTPHIVRNQSDAEAIKRTEAAKMGWCLADVTKIYGEAGLRRRTDEWSDGEIRVIYPDSKSTPATESKEGGPELLPAPSGQPTPAPRSGDAEPVPADPSAALPPRGPQQAMYQPPVQSPGYAPASSNTAQPAMYQQPAAGPASFYR